MFSLFKRKEVSKEPFLLENSLSGQIETFKPLEPGAVTMYSCGPTVYDHIHIGNLRAYLLPDLLTRLFHHEGYQVKSTINFTDFGHLTDDADAGEDKMVKGMKREGYEITLENMRDFALPYIESFKEDNLAFGNLPPTKFARASDYIKEQKNLIETLEQKGYTYETSDGVYFDISKFPQYGRLGNIDLNAIKSGARVAINEEKKHPADFALWKKAGLGWESKWGRGFPGWHIECTAMAFATLGKQIDIHTGGEDLMYTHHNGEIAQAECVTKKTYVAYWLHNAHVKVNDEKLAKSAGNGLRLLDLQAKGYSPFDYRYLLLQSHYRTPVNFTFEALDGAKTAVRRLWRFVYEEYDGIIPTEVDKTYEARFVLVLSNDLDTAGALAILWELIRDKNIKPGTKLATLRAFDSLINLGLSKNSIDGKAELGRLSEDEIPKEIKNWLEKREAARIASNWDEADRLREALRLQGYEVEDTESGPRLTKTN